MKKTLLIKSTLQTDNTDNTIIVKTREILSEKGFAESDIYLFINSLIGLLDDYSERFGKGTEIEYSIYKYLGRIEAKVFIPGEQYDPFENGDNSEQRKIQKLLNVSLGSYEYTVSYSYHVGRNIITVRVPFERKKKSILKDPMIWAVILGVGIGLICLILPKAANNFVIEELLDPIMSVILKVVSGIMGPVIFFSLLSSIISLDSVNKLTNMGFKIIKRFILCILFVTVVAIGISLIFFGNFGPGGIDFAPNQIITMLLDILPTNVVRPFLDNNTPQIVVLAFATGVALLVLGERTAQLNNIIHQLNDCIMRVMKIVLKLLPAIPFLSIATAIGKGNASVFIEGWKFIAASYIAYTLCLVIKLIKTSSKTKLPIKTILKNIFPIMKMAFTTASTVAPLKKIYDVSDQKFHIKKEFSSLWVPMCTAMMALQTTINVIVATIMMTELLGLPISITFLFVLIFLTLEMSLASPGTTGSWVIAFETFSMPTSYVGLFSAYRVVVKNYATAAAIAYNMCEQVELAYKMDAIETESNVEPQEA